MFRPLLCSALVIMEGLWSVSPREVDQMVEQARQEWNIPGLAIGVIHKGKEIKVAGYGVRKRGEEEAVDADTLFQINSLTKAFTSLLLNQLAMEGRFDFDATVQSYFPDFQLKDRSVGEQATFRDFLCHRSGLPGNNCEGWRIFWGTGRSFEELIQRLALVDQAYPFRSRFSYNNLGYMIGGRVAALITGLSWGELCQRKIFDPLGMKRSCVTYSSLMADDNVAWPHVPAKIEWIESRRWWNWERDSLEAASGIISSAHDMALWMNYCLSHGSLFTETQKPEIEKRPEDVLHEVDQPLFPIISHGQSLYYGMGWWTYTLENRRIYRHTGSCPGTQSIIALVPEEELGIVILANQSPQPSLSCLMNALLDKFLDCEEVDWNQEAHKAIVEIEKRKRDRREKHESTRRGIPSLPFKEYLGEYVHPAYGSIQINIVQNTLCIEFLFSHEKGTLRHWEANLFAMPKELLYAVPDPWFCEFMTQNGIVSGLKIPPLGLFTRSKNSLDY